MGLRVNPFAKELGRQREVVPWQTLVPPETDCTPSSDYKAYEDAAEEFHPYIPFFATFDSKVCHPEAPSLLSTALQTPSQSRQGASSLPTHATPPRLPPLHRFQMT